MIQDTCSKEFINEISCTNKLLIIQDIDGVCIPLVKNPLDREINKDYVITVSKLKEEFCVLTCGEHEGYRGVNRIIERAFKSIEEVRREGLYLPGLAACGIEHQDKYGNISYPGIAKEEIMFLAEVPNKMERLLRSNLRETMPSLSKEQIEEEARNAVCDTRFSPTLNLNSLFQIAGTDLELKISLQRMMDKIMLEIMEYAKENKLGNSFYLHKSPNLGKDYEEEIIKYSTEFDIGTTDIQLIINGALKEAGVLVLINKYIKEKSGEFPFGKDFNVRNAPKSIDDLINLCKKKVDPKEMPTLIGIGDTVTSNKEINSGKWLRGGSDRGFLTLIQELGIKFNKNNKTVFVDSSDGEVYRPSTKESCLLGISDSEDQLNFNLVLNGGHKEYIKWIKELTEIRSMKIRD